MFYVAPLFLILAARLGRARGAAAAGSRRSLPPPRRRCSLLAIPFERFVTTSAISDTLMLLPWWSILAQGWTALDRARSRLLGGVAFAAAFLFVPRAVCARPARCSCSPTGSSRSKPIWFGPYPTASSRLARARSSRGSAARRATGSTVPCRPAQDVARALDGSRRPVHGQPERVLQPARRPDLLHHRPDPRRRRRDPVTVDRRRRRAPADGRALAPGYLLADGSVEPDAVAVARDRGSG